MEAGGLLEGDGVGLGGGVVAGGKGEEGWGWSSVFSNDGEESGELEFGGVSGGFVAENADFDFVGVSVDGDGPGVEVRFRCDGVEEDGWGPRPLRGEGQGVGDGVVIDVKGIGDVEERSSMNAWNIGMCTYFVLEVGYQIAQRWEYRVVV